MICRFRFKRGRCTSKKIENSNLLQSGVLLVVEKPWRFSNSGLEAGPVQYYRHRRDPGPLGLPGQKWQIVPATENDE
jgi:hypothetical protein